MPPGASRDILVAFSVIIPRMPLDRPLRWAVGGFFRAARDREIYPGLRLQDDHELCNVIAEAQKLGGPGGLLMMLSLRSIPVYARSRVGT